MKHLLFCFLLTTCPLVAKTEKLALTVNAEAAILINADTGVVLYEKNAQTLHYPASITKIATAIYALEKASDKMDVMIAGDQDCVGTVTEEALRRSSYTLPAYLLIPGGSHIGIKRGELLSFRDLMYGMMIASGDDAANVIAKYVGGTIPQFVEELNIFVKKIGCNSTTFLNPHGLHHPKQQTTAADMATLTRYSLKNSIFRDIVATVRYTRPKTNKQEPTTLVQTNRLLRSGPFYYPKAIGVKTGYYSLAGSTLVAAATDGDRTLIAVLLKAPDRKEMFQDTIKMFNAAFSQPKVKKTLLKKGAQKFALNLPGAKQPIHTFINDDVSLEYYPAEEQKVKCLLYWDKELKLPVTKEQRVGELILQYEDGQMARKTPLYAQNNVSSSWFFGIKNFFGSGLLKILAVIVVCLFLGFFVFQLKNGQ